VKVAVVGVTGAVGREMLAVLEQRGFPVDELVPMASARSAGGRLQALGAEHEIRAAAPDGFRGVDLALFSAGSGVAKELAPAARDAGALVVDNSSAFRMEPDCPLVVPEINADDLAGHHGIVANPNCSTILLTMALAPLERAVGIARVVLASYQAVSGAGARAMAELHEQEEADRTGGVVPQVCFPKPISHNVIPWVQGIGPDGYSTEETKVRDETRRILGRAGLPVTATCVRVPVLRAHAQAIHVELARPFTVGQAEDTLSRAPGVRLWTGDFPTPRDAAGDDLVHVGRVRLDRAFEPGLAMWGVMDQLRKGAALNAVQIAEQVLGVRTGA